MSLHFLFATFFDPRGRCDRRGLLLAAVVLLALQGLAAGAYWAGAIARNGPLSIALDVIFLWPAIAATSKRLHDAGLSAWWIGKAFLAVILSTIVLTIVLMCVLPDAAFEPGEPGYLIILAGNMLPVLALCLWMHFAKGQSGPNRFGPETGASGFSYPDVSAGRAGTAVLPSPA